MPHQLQQARVFGCTSRRLQENISASLPQFFFVTWREVVGGEQVRVPDRRSIAEDEVMHKSKADL